MISSNKCHTGGTWRQHGHLCQYCRSLLCPYQTGPTRPSRVITSDPSLAWNYPAYHFKPVCDYQSVYRETGIVQAEASVGRRWSRLCPYYKHPKSQHLACHACTYASWITQENQLTHWGRMTHICVSKLGHHWLRYWLVAWTAPSHYLNQCCNIVDKTLRNKLQWNFNRYSSIFIQ